MQFLSLLQSVIGFPVTSLKSTEVSLNLRILSHNIRYATSSPFTNERPWPERLPLILNELSYNTRYLDGTSTTEYTAGIPDTSSAAFICLQEVLHVQLVDILLGLNKIEPSSLTTPSEALPDGPLWAHIGVAREDGQKKGEYSPIIYPVRIWKLLYFENIWLSPTPDKPSKGWDAGSERILTLGVFEHRATGQRLIACCTHLDNVGGKARKKGVEMILGKIQQVREKWSESKENHTILTGMNDNQIPVFLAGDFNSFPDEEAYLTMQASDLMCDLRDYVEPKKRYGEEITFTGFQPEKDKEEQGRIDFIWLGPKDNVGNGSIASTMEANGHVKQKALTWGVSGYSVLPNVYEDGIYSSDHRCVVGDVSLHLSKPCNDAKYN